MSARGRWAVWFAAHREASCWLANLGLALGGGGAISPPSREPARCPLRALLPEGAQRAARLGSQR